MKTRSGFVSNSSSASFVAVLPHGFDVKAMDTDKLYESIWGMFDEDDGCTPSPKEFKRDLIKTIKAALKSHDGLSECECEIGIDILEEALADYIVSSWETNGGSGSGHCVILDAGKISNCAQNKRKH